MSLENATFIANLVASNPEGTDPKSQGDDHLRMIKQVLKNQFAGFTQGIPITKTESEINSMLIAGMFGIGGPALNTNESDLTLADIPSGFYYVTAQNLGLLPVNVHSYMIYLDNAAAGFAMRLVVQGDTGVLWYSIKLSGVWQTWRLSRDTANTPSQAHLVDLTSNAIMTPGSFGVGVAIQAATSANLNAAPHALVPYNVRYLGNSWTNAPTGENAALAVVEWRADTADWGEQRFKAISSKCEYTRYFTGGTTWSAWQKVATVSSANRVANGFQIIDGVQRCWGTHAAGLAPGTSGIITFPAAFSACWSVNVNCQAFSANNIYGVNVVAITPSTFTAGYYSNTGSNSGPLFWQAVGAPV